MKIYESETFQVSLNETLNRLTLHFRGEVSSEVCKKGFLFALYNARVHHVKSWLLDFREVDQFTEETETWIQVHVFPQIMAHLGAGNHMAVVVPDSCYQSMLGEYGTDGLKSYNCFIIINTFQTSETAVAWLEANTLNSR